MIAKLPTDVYVQEVNDDFAKEFTKTAKSVIGHPATAEIVSEKTGTKVEMNREQITLNPGDELLVFQLLQRLPEGKTLTKEEMQEIPAKWILVKVKEVKACS